MLAKAAAVAYSGVVVTTWREIFLAQQRELQRRVDRAFKYKTSTEKI